MSITNELIQDNPDKYETLLESRILGKQLQMKLNQYKAIQNQYDTLLQYENNKRNQAEREDAVCKSRNPGTAVVKAVKTKCRAGGCDDALGSTGWIDYCNADNEEYTCCGTNNTTVTFDTTGFQDWTDIPNTSYKYALTPNPTASTDSWKFLGKTDNLTNCKLKAVEDKNTAFSSVVYYPSDFGDSWNKSCFGGVKGGNINPQPEPKTITSLAPNGTTILGGDEGERLLKEMKKLKTEITALTKKAKDNEGGLYKTRNLLSDELSSQNDDLELLLDKLQNDRNEINIMLSEPDETAGEEDSSIRQSSSYTTFVLWMLLVMVSIFVAYHIYSREIYDISIWAYVFVAIWIVIILKQYYSESKEYGRKSWNYVSSFIPNLPI